MKPVVVVDYGVGNLLNVERACRHLGVDVVVSADAQEIAKAARLILPGVGAFESGMAGLAERGLVDVLRDYGQSGRPILGICLGMQLLFDESDEFGKHEGLGLIPGNVAAIPSIDTTGRSLRVPHIGWEKLLPSRQSGWAEGLLSNTKPGEWMYFVHSFCAIPTESEYLLAHCQYGGHKIAATVRREAVYGCQFHPEKSGAAGLALLDRFLKT
jgi:glutamine amidotransferase